MTKILTATPPQPKPLVKQVKVGHGRQPVSNPPTPIMAPTHGYGWTPP